MITFTPLSASASSSSSSEPICYLLELDEARILLDMGQRDLRVSAEQASWAYEEKVRELAPTLSLVLLSHSSTQYLGLYPYARARWGLTCPVYATQPTVEMGRVVCLAEFESWRSEVLVSEVEEEEETNGEPSSPSIRDEVVRSKGKEPLRGPFVPTIEEIHEAFDWIKAIRYNQPLHLGGDLSHLLLTPFPSGHTLGGSLFKIRSPTSGTVLYAVGVNHTGERHLDGMVGGPGSGASGYNDGVLRPDLLIVEGGRSEVVNVKRKSRETALLDLVTSTLETGHSLLLPIDPSPRLLELLVLFDQHWSFRLTGPQTRTRSGGGSIWPFPLCLVSRTAQDMVAFARSLIEWMGGVVRDSGGSEEVVSRRGRKGRRRQGGGAMGSEYGVLDFRHVEFFNTPTELLQAHPLSRPKLVLAVPPTMSHGPSRWLFTAMAGMPGNVILLTSKPEEGSLARDLFDRWEAVQNGESKWGKGRIGVLDDLKGEMTMTVRISYLLVELLKGKMNSKVPLIGGELEAHLEAERLQNEREAAQQAAMERSRRMLEADDLDSESESEGEEAPEDGIVISRAAKTDGFGADGEDARQMSFDIFVKGQQTRRDRGEGGGMARYRMFPFLEKRARKVDEYGEGLDIGIWLRKGKEIAEEGETEEVREAKKRKVEEEEKEKDAPEPPSKYVTEEITVQLRASIFFIDMEGLHDGQAIKTIISDLQPRKMILVRSSTGPTQSLLSFFEPLPGVTNDIYSPPTNEEIRIGEQVASYSVMLGDSITPNLSTNWSKFEGYEVAMIDGKIVFAAGSTVPTVETSGAYIAPIREIKPEVDEQTTTSPETVAQTEDVVMVKEEPVEHSPAPIESTKSKTDPLALPQSLFVGDLRLAALKARLASKEIPAEFAGEGVLICGPGVKSQTEGKPIKGGSIVAVRKLDEGRIVVEGSLGKVYFDVRRELYGGLAQVVGA